MVLVGAQPKLSYQQVATIILKQDENLSVNERENENKYKGENIRNLTRVGYTDPVGKPIFDVMSLYSLTVNLSVAGQKWTLLTTFGLTREPTY